MTEVAKRFGVSSRSTFVIADQKPRSASATPARTLTVEDADTAFRIYDRDRLLVELARTTSKAVARFKVRRPGPPRPGPVHVND